MINPTLISREIELDLAKLQLLSKVAADDNDFPVHIDTNLRRQKTTLDIIEYTSKLDCALIHAARSACEVARWASTLASITGLRQQCNATRSGIHVCHGVKHCYVAIHSRYDQGLGLNLLVRSHMHGHALHPAGHMQRPLFSCSVRQTSTQHRTSSETSHACHFSWQGCVFMQGFVAGERLCNVLHCRHRIFVLHR